MGPGFDPHRRHRIVSLSKTHLLPTVLVKPKKSWHRPDMTETLLTGTLSLNTNIPMFIFVSFFHMNSYHPWEPAIAMMSTATDMAKWVKFNLQKGKTEAGDQLIDEKLISEMHWPSATYDSPETLGDRFLTKPQYPVDEIQLGYGYGWGISLYRGMCFPIFCTYHVVSFSSSEFYHLTSKFYLSRRSSKMIAAMKTNKTKNMTNRKKKQI